MFKILAILPGTPLKKEHCLAPELIVECNTLIMGRQLFNSNKLVNNFKSIDAVRNQNNMVDVYSFSKRNSMTAFIKSGLRIRKLTSGNNVDFIYSFWGGPASLVTVLFSRKPVFLTLLGSDILGSYDKKHRSNFKGFIIAAFTKMACRKAKGVIVMSEEMKNKLSEKVKKKTIVLPECINLDVFKPMDPFFCKQYLNYPAASKVILFFPGDGRIVKNRDFALRVISKLFEMHPGLLFIEVEHVENSELVYYYNAADLLLVTSLHEGSNNTIKEALACNCPVVSSDSGDAASRLSGIESCFVMDDFNVDEYVERINQVFLTGRASNGRDTVMPLSPENTADKLISFFNERL